MRAQRVPVVPRLGDVASSGSNMLAPVLLFLVFAQACGGGEGPAVIVEPPPVTSQLGIVPGSDPLHLGEERALLAQVRLPNGGVRNAVATEWTLPGGVAGDLSSAGVLYARATGSLTVVARAEGLVDTVTVSVVAPTVQTGALALSTSPRELAYDARRNRLYLTHQAPSVLAVDLGTLSFAAPIPLTAPAAGIDLANANTLVVSLPEPSALVFTDLQLETQRAYLIPEQFGSNTPEQLAVMANGHVLVTLGPPPLTGNRARIVDYDPATNTQRHRDDIGSGAVYMVRPPDRSFLALVYRDGAPVQVDLVNARTTNRDLARQTIASPFAPAIAVSANVKRVLVHRTLFNMALDSVAHVSVPGYVTGGATALSTSAAMGYFAVDGAVVEMDFASGLEQRRFPVSAPVRRILVLPAGDRLVVATDGAVHVFAL